MKVVSKMEGWGRNIAVAVLVAVASSAAADGIAGDDASACGVEFGISGGWESRYVSEGRDNLDGDGLVSSTVEAAFKGFALNACYASSPDTDYRELNLGAGYTFTWNDLEANVSYTHLRFLSDEEDEDDNEIGVGLAYSGLPAGLSVGIDGCYSFEAEGVFLEASIAGEYEVMSWLTLAPSAVLGWNLGYIPDGHDGANHCALSLEAIVPLKDGLELVGYIAQSWALDADPDKYEEDGNLKDMFRGGVALCATF